MIGAELAIAWPICFVLGLLVARVHPRPEQPILFAAISATFIVAGTAICYFWAPR